MIAWERIIRRNMMNRTLPLRDSPSDKRFFHELIKPAKKVLTARDCAHTQKT